MIASGKSVAATRSELAELAYDAACMHSLAAEDTENDSGTEREQMIHAGLQALRLSVESGWDDFDHLRSDPDLGLLRATESYRRWLDGLQPEGGH